jgi:transposase-like protein
MSDYGLSTQQLAVICALSSGVTMAAAAEQAGVHRNTINNWRRNSPPFQHGLAHAQYDRAQLFREKIEERIDLALKTIDEILADPKAPASIRLKAALAIITVASTPPAPKKQIELDIEKIVIQKSPPQTVTEDQLAPAPLVHNNAQPAPAPTAAPCPTLQPQIVHKDAQSTPAEVPVHPSAAISQNPPVVHKDAQSQPSSAQLPYRRESPKIGRNQPCPCGSGRKYKTCCLDKRLPAAA